MTAVRTCDHHQRHMYVKYLLFNQLSALCRLMCFTYDNVLQATEALLCICV
jgi:hypothetical protein